VSYRCWYSRAAAAAGGDGETVALASCRLVAEGAAELGLLIEDEWQHQGVGRLLLHDLVTHAARAGVRVVDAQLLAEQAWIAGLLRPYGTGRLHSARDGVVTVSVRPDVRMNERSPWLPAPTSA
jgi:GNAT superfamily N-acetyltransferase